jgi:hypothetical protein
MSDFLPVQDSLASLLSKPTPDALRHLRGELQVVGMPGDAPIMSILSDFYHFLNDLVASSTARQYSHFASKLDMAAVAGVALQNLLERDNSEGWWRRLLLGAVSEALMVLAARQYVKAWEEEMKATYGAAAWNLGEEFWRTSVEMQPELGPGQRRQLVDRLIAPIYDEANNGTIKAAIIVYFYELLLLIRIQRDIRRIDAA